MSDDDLGEFEFDSQDVEDFDANQEQTKDSENQKLQRKEQKLLQKQRKEQRPNAPIISQAKVIWEELRKKNQSERSELVRKMMKIIAGHVKDIIFKHDASRIIQCCLKYGNTKQRDEIAEELKGSYCQLSQSQYGKFIVSRILKYCSSKYRDLVITEFYGKVSKLVRHKEASVILDEAYTQYANAQQRNNLMQEFYGPEYRLFKKDFNLETLLAENPEKKDSVLKTLRETLDSVLEKGSFNLGRTHILHRVLYEYLTLSSPLTVAKDMIELLKENLVSILHTRDGARVAQYCILYASPKDRKLIIKSFKGFITSIAKEQYGHGVLISCFECVDDTVLLSKAIISELFKEVDLMHDKFASKIFLYLLTGRNRKHQPDYMIQELQKTDEARKLTTKKDDNVRREQLLEAALPLFIEVCTEHANVLVRDRTSSEILAAVASLPCEPLLEKLANLMKDAEITAGEFHPVKKLHSEAIKEKQQQLGIDMAVSLLINRNSTFVYKNLLRQPKDQILSWKQDFAEKLWDVLESKFKEWIQYCLKVPNSSGTCFVFVAIYENGSERVKKEMKKIAKSLDLSIAASNDKKRKIDSTSAIELLISYIK